MCNLSQGIKEDGIAIGEAIGETKGEAKAEARIILNMHKNGFTIEQIAKVTDKDIEDVKSIIARNNRE
ncbi:MAG: hypothetical protein SPL51_01645 [Lachnospiraceae bacterium]|nr:hypothetical protein [Lachnospiraceae bacterium]